MADDISEVGRERKEGECAPDYVIKTGKTNESEKGGPSSKPSSLASSFVVVAHHVASRLGSTHPIYWAIFRNLILFFLTFF